MGEKVDIARTAPRIDAMSAASGVMTWNEICSNYPSKWLLVVDIVWGADGWIETAVVVEASPSSKDLIDRRDHPGATLTNTGGWSPWGHSFRRERL